MPTPRSTPTDVPVPSSTSRAISPDSGDLWTAEGAWQVTEGVYRIPLPLPMDGLRAVNVYVLVGESGLTLIDGGWAIPEARDVFERGLQQIGAGFGDINSFLVTHMHRDHYSMARTLGTEFGISVALGAEDKSAIKAVQDHQPDDPGPFSPVLLECGASEIAKIWAEKRAHNELDQSMWRDPDTWLTGGPVQAGERVLEAVHTPGHTPGHYVFVDGEQQLLFAGDHVLPTITPSIGFVHPTPEDPLSDFMSSLAKVRSLPDLRVLPAHGPLAPSSHARADELLAHHEDRLTLSLEQLNETTGTSAAEAAAGLTWTRHERSLNDLDPFNQGMAILETRAHLAMLVARGQAISERCTDGVVRYQAVESA